MKWVIAMQSNEQEGVRILGAPTGGRQTKDQHCPWRCRRGSIHLMGLEVWTNEADPIAQRIESIVATLKSGEGFVRDIDVLDKRHGLGIGNALEFGNRHNNAMCLYRTFRIILYIYLPECVSKTSLLLLGKIDSPFLLFLCRTHTATCTHLLFALGRATLLRISKRLERCHVSVHVHSTSIH